MNARSSRSAVAAMCLAFATSAGAQGSLATHPIVGTWTFNAAKSTVAYTIAFAAAPNGAMTMTWPDQKYTFRIDGKEYPVPMLAGTTATWSQKGATRWEAIYKVRGTVDNIDQISLSQDGKQLTMHTDRVLTKTKEDVVFDRVSGEAGLMGTWKATVVAQGESTLQYSAAGNRLTAHIVPSEERWSGPLDGHDYPATAGPSIPGGLTWAGRQDGPRTIRFVVKRNGTTIQFATLAVSADGKTLEVGQINGDTEAAPNRNRLIFERR